MFVGCNRAPFVPFEPGDRWHLSVLPTLLRSSCFALRQDERRRVDEQASTSEKLIKCYRSERGGEWSPAVSLKEEIPSVFLEAVVHQITNGKRFSTNKNTMFCLHEKYVHYVISYQIKVLAYQW